MKKTLVTIVFIFMSLGLFACENFGISKPTETGFKAFIKEIPSEISDDYLLPNIYEDEKIEWYLNDVLLEDNVISYYFTLKDVEVKLKAVISGDRETKKFIIKATSFVTDLIISTKDNEPVYSKEEYKDATFKLNAGNKFSQEQIDVSIRGRGNSTWGYPKKPYRLKFDKRTSVLGMASAKSYVLLAEYNDKSLMRNYMAHYFTQFLNVERSFETRYVNLTFNGEYQGLYLLTEQVQVDKNRLSIDQSESPDGGFLIELERDYDRASDEGVEGINWFRMQSPDPNDRNKWGEDDYIELYYVLKDPKEKDFDSSDIIPAKFDYIKNYFQEFEQAVLTSGNYEEYIDVDNFIDYFILAEWFKQVDIGYSSAFAYKDKGGLMKMGPSWDFDISSGNGDYYASGPKGFWADYHPWFSILIRNKAFEERFIARFNELMDNHFDDFINEIDRVSNLIEPYADFNFDKWDILNEYVWPNPPAMVEANTFLKQIKYFKDYMTKRKDWLLTELNKNGYYGYLFDNDEGHI